MKKKPRLCLLSNKTVKNAYGKVVVYLCDDTIHPFNLDEWDMYEDRDSIEFRKINKQTVEIFFTTNVMRIVFDKNEIKSDIGSPLKPVA